MIKSENPVLFVAEISANHLGSFERAKELVKSAAKSGANAVKFQTYTPDTMTLNLPNFINGLFCETNPIAVKYLLYHMGIFANNVLRLPMTPLDEKYHEQVVNSYETTLELQIKYLTKNKK